ncbi:MAG: hypothetical protein K9N09_06995 [Candidatus Cloacimonetes bacterium]|nr:hypothetical protein [Candidatus Cloacimonadota bacterium]MCF7814970.1 hypothetical protein [Candidatus Cloacimonadota bacterium]MCF7868431.1 hypothetical protein [Candidatus Cloacimonadota bacterium]MCF7883904.1 hypothetical protein [Candidatus Cloacimonadota bacterium]
MKKLKNSLFLFFVLFVLGCSFNKSIDHPQKEKLLIQNLQKWQNFKADGIIEANYKNFVFRKNIHIDKAHSNMKITVFDSGIFGLKPEPFISLEIDSLISIKSQSEPEKNYQIADFPGLNFILDSNSLIQYKNEIITNEKLQLSNGTKITFSEIMQLKKINIPSNSWEIDFFYHEDLSSIEVYEKNQLLAKIEIDRIRREDKQ